MLSCPLFLPSIVHIAGLHLNSAVSRISDAIVNWANTATKILYNNVVIKRNIKLVVRFSFAGGFFAAYAN